MMWSAQGEERKRRGGPLARVGLVLPVLLLVCGAAREAAAAGCLDEDGNEVDSFHALKSNNGAAYYVYGDGTFTLSPYDLTSMDGGAITNTLAQIYDTADIENQDVAYAMYNDQPPPDKDGSSSYAHSKGVFFTDGSQGFFMAHSVPHWPNAYDDGLAGIPSLTYSQSFVCLTVDLATMDELASYQIMHHPDLYDSFISDSLAATMPTFADWLDGAKSSETNMTGEVKTVGGQVVHVIGKSGSWGLDFYEDLVAPTLDSDLNAETWRDGSGRMPSFCTTSGGDDDYMTEYGFDYTVNMVATITMPDGVTWDGTQDHSKYCTATDAHKQYTCVGDINNMCSQETRGGGTYCIFDSDLWHAFDDAMTSLEPCFDEDPCSSSTQCYWCE